MVILLIRCKYFYTEAIDLGVAAKWTKWSGLVPNNRVFEYNAVLPYKICPIFQEKFVYIQQAVKKLYWMYV